MSYESKVSRSRHAHGFQRHFRSKEFESRRHPYFFGGTLKVKRAIRYVIFPDGMTYAVPAKMRPFVPSQYPVTEKSLNEYISGNQSCRPF